MRLFLSSYRFGDYGDVLLEMLGEDPVVGIITNAKDDKTSEERAQSIQELVASFQELGIRTHEIDLRPFFGQADFLRSELGKYTAVWVAGGNTFVLRSALRASGGDELLRELVAADKLLYGGESAGAVIATSTLQGVEFGDDPDIVPEGYPDEDLWDGLGLVSYSIVPHYESGWEGEERMIEVLGEDNIPYKTLTDQQVIVVNGDEEERL